MARTLRSTRTPHGTPRHPKPYLPNPQPGFNLHSKARGVLEGCQCVWNNRRGDAAALQPRRISRCLCHAAAMIMISHVGHDESRSCELPAPDVYQCGHCGGVMRRC
eukprot:3359056-Rhodomonas_salina.1